MQLTLRSGRFPTGTVVGIYAGSEWSGSTPGPEHSPRTSPLTTGVVGADGSLLVTGLPPNEAVWAVAQVNGDWRWVAGHTDKSKAALFSVDDPEDQPFIIDVPANQLEKTMLVRKGGVELFSIDKDGIFNVQGVNGPLPLALKREVPFVDVAGLTGDPGSVDDWGVIINAQLVAGKHRLIFDEFGDYPVITPLDVAGRQSLLFEGVNGFVWPQDMGLHQFAPARLVWKGAGATPMATHTNCNGVTYRDLGLMYDNAGFTGELMSNGNGGPVVVCYERCQIIAKDHFARSAKMMVSYDLAIASTIDRCIIGGAKWGVLGRKGTGSFSNANRIIGGTVFINNEIAHIGNIYQQWALRDITFEMSDVGNGGTPAIIDADMSGFAPGEFLPSDFTLKDFWTGDPALAEPYFQQRDHNVWKAVIEGGEIGWANGDPAVPIFNLQGHGKISIRHNPKLVTNDGVGIVVDLGDVVANPLSRKESFQWKDNGGVNTQGEAIIHRSGHHSLDIDGEQTGGVNAVKTLNGHERTGYPDRQPLPTISALAALVGGSVNVWGSDLAGIIQIATTTGHSAGLLAQLTFGTPGALEPPDFDGTKQVPVVQLTPVNLGGTTGPAAALAGLYYDVPNGPVVDKFKIGTANVLPDNATIRIAYRVIFL